MEFGGRHEAQEHCEQPLSWIPDNKRQQNWSKVKGVNRAKRSLAMPHWLGIPWRLALAVEPLRKSDPRSRVRNRMKIDTLWCYRFQPQWTTSMCMYNYRLFQDTYFLQADTNRLCRLSGRCNGLKITAYAPCQGHPITRPDPDIIFLKLRLDIDSHIA